MKKRTYFIFVFFALIALTLVNVNVTSLKSNDVTITSLKKAFGQDPEIDLTKYWKGTASCYRISDGSWCCLRTQCLPKGPEDCSSTNCPSGTH